MDLQSKTLEIIEPTYAASKYLHHEVIGKRKNGKRMVIKPSLKPALPTSLNLTWKLWAKSNVLSRVKSVYEPFFGCVLPSGLAHKVHIMGNLMWSLRQMGCVGIAGSSECSVWTKVQAIGAINVPIWSKTSTEELKQSETGDYKPGTYRYFDRALQLIDVAGKAVPSMPKKQMTFSPLEIAKVITGMHATMEDTHIVTTNMPAAYVTYMDPALLQMAQTGWQFYPLDFSSGQIMVSREGKGVPFDTLATLFAKFVTYRIYYPFCRVPWPGLSAEIQVPVVTIRNGKPIFQGKEEDWFALATKISPPVGEELDGEEVAELVELAEFTVVGQEDPVLEPADPIPVAPKPVIKMNADPAPSPPDDAQVGDNGTDDEDEEDMFKVRKVSPAEARELAERLRLS